MTSDHFKIDKDNVQIVTVTLAFLKFDMRHMIGDPPSRTLDLTYPDVRFLNSKFLTVSGGLSWFWASDGDSGELPVTQ